MKPAEDGRRYDATRVLDGAMGRSGADPEVPLAPGTVTLPLCSRPNASPLGLKHNPIPDRSPGDFHSTGASYDPRKDSRGTKPARVTL